MQKQLYLLVDLIALINVFTFNPQQSLGIKGVNTNDSICLLI